MGLFGGKRDFICIASGIALLPFSVFACIARPQFDFESMLILYFLVGFCFWGWTHPALTIGNAFNVGAFAICEAARAGGPALKLENGHARLARRVLLLFCFCFAYYLFSTQRHRLPETLSWFILPTKSLGVSWTMVGFAHNLKQFQGVSLLYGDGSHAVSPLRARIVRLGINGILISGVTRAAIIGAILPNWRLAHSVLGWIAILLAIVVLAAAYSSGNASRKRKFLFDLRIFHYALFGWNIFPSLATAALHGLEYYFLTMQMRERQARPAAEGATVAGMKIYWGRLTMFAVVVIVALSALGPTFGLFQKLFAGAIWLPHLTIVISAFLFSVFFVHAYLDYRFFRFRNSENRTHILPLIRSRDSAAA